MNPTLKALILSGILFLPVYPIYIFSPFIMPKPNQPWNPMVLLFLVTVATFITVLYGGLIYSILKYLGRLSLPYLLVSSVMPAILLGAASLEISLFLLLGFYGLWHATMFWLLLPSDRKNQTK